MNQFLFKTQLPLTRALMYDLDTGAQERRLEVFRWEERLVAHEKERDLWWGTLDAIDHRNAWEFWHESVANERIGRLISLERGARLESNGVTLAIGNQIHVLHVLVAADNSGLVRVEGASKWHTFGPAKVPMARNPKAHRPTIWAPSFHTRFARETLHAIHRKYELAHLPQTVSEEKAVQVLWPQGKAALPMRLASAALGFEKESKQYSQSTLAQFWREFLLDHIPPDYALYEGWKGRRDELLRSPEVNLPGTLAILRNAHYNQGQPVVTFTWQSTDVTLQITLDSTFSSAHEQLEAGLELRGWLSQFFLASDVESWLRP